MKGRREGARAGAAALSLLAVPFNAMAVELLAGEPRSVTDLRRTPGAPPPTTMRGHMRSLVAAGVVQRHRESSGSISYELSRAGRDLQTVAESLAVWLAQSPEGSIELGTTEAKSVVRTLVEGWAVSIVRALAARPLSLTELDRVISCVSYPSLERRLSAMRMLGMVQAVPSQGRSTPYTATDWLRCAVAPLAAAARWEQSYQRDQATPITNRDVEAAFLLSLPLLRLPADLSGSCRLAVQVGNGTRHNLVGVIAEARDGRAISRGTRIGGTPDAWAFGPASAWFSAVISQDAKRLELGGERHLASGLVESLHDALLPNALTDKAN